MGTTPLAQEFGATSMQGHGLRDRFYVFLFADTDAERVMDRRDVTNCQSQSLSRPPDAILKKTGMAASQMRATEPVLKRDF